MEGNSSSIANSFVSLLRYHHFSFLVPYPQKRLHRKERADGTGAREQGNRGLEKAMVPK